MRRYAFVGAFALLALAAPAAAQEPHAVSEAELQAMALERAAESEVDREALRSLLRHPEVKRIARVAGVDLRRATDAVEVLDPGELERLAPGAREATSALAGGDSKIVISSTTLIIALLVLLIILVAD